MKKIALIGSTGSIGVQTLEVVRAHPDEFSVCALSAHSSLDLLLSQIEEFKPACAALTGAGAVKAALPAVRCKLYCGDEGALRMLEECCADVVVVACSGFAGLKYSLKAAELGVELALANKETLVCGGELVMPRIKTIVPIDSEHSALWQCMSFNRKAEVSRLIITASGGPFKGRDFESLSGVTPAEALNHPTWRMGAKITIDSATLLNKGYEVIEAHHLYGVPYSRIQTVIQPQSIIHSMVEFADGAILAQMSYPTMALPIQLALTYPERLQTDVPRMDFSQPLTLGFNPLRREAYPLYDLALKCGEEQGILPTALNAASEVAVNAFLRGKIKFTDIYAVANEVVCSTSNGGVEGYERLEEADAVARRKANKIIEKR